jgi:glycosyltransferase involved in cell wall biosynthesis
VFEAMAMETVPIVPAVNANRELVDDEVGAVIEPRDRVDDYVDRLRELVADPAALRRLGIAARQRVIERFPLATMAAEHTALYERLLAGRPPQG